LAGYEDDFEKKFFAYNEGLKSRFTSVIFEDFEEEELSEIWTNLRSERGWWEQDGICRVVVKRIGKMACRKGLGSHHSPVGPHFPVLGFPVAPPILWRMPKCTDAGPGPAHVLPCTMGTNLTTTDLSLAGAGARAGGGNPSCHSRDLGLWFEEKQKNTE
jgi:hypothetical protein